MADAETTASIAEEARAVARAVVGQQTTDADAERAVVTDRSVEESDGGVAAFMGQDLREGEAGVVVDGDVNELPASAATGPRAISGDAMTGLEEASELLDVEMQQVAGGSMFVATQGWSRFEIADTTEAFAAQDAADGGGREADDLGDVSAGPTLTTQRNDALDEGPRGPSRAAVRSRGTIVQTGDALAAMAPATYGWFSPRRHRPPRRPVASAAWRRCARRSALAYKASIVHSCGCSFGLSGFAVVCQLQLPRSGTE